jgi:dTDP-4-dehydrorhamnose 3,5-epimerase
MRFSQTLIPGAFLVDVELHADDRGSFVRTWCAREFATHGLAPCLAQCSVSINTRPGTLRGMHYQIAPHEEAKVVQCVRGAIYDVAIDLRRDSAAFKRWVAVELTAGNRRMLYVPAGVAHGFQTLEPDTEVLYLISEFYAPESARGVRWDDPAFGVRWPAIDRRHMSDRDRMYPDFVE